MGSTSRLNQKSFASLNNAASQLSLENHQFSATSNSFRRVIKPDANKGNVTCRSSSTTDRNFNDATKSNLSKQRHNKASMYLRDIKEVLQQDQEIV